MSENTKLPAYRLTTSQVLEEFDSSPNGLSADKAKELLEQFGTNALHEIHKESLWYKYAKQFKDRMILLLLASSLIAFYLGDVRSSLVLLALILFNTLIGFTQEYNAERIMDSLEKLVVAEAKVVRGGALVQIPSTEIVPGDIVYIEEGDSVPADLRILDESDLSCNDFALTGESNPSRKFAHELSQEVELGDRQNLLFMGTTIATGHGTGVVVGTGMQTELGRIANLSQDTYADVSPLQKEMNNIAKRVTQGTIVLCSVLLPIAIKTGLSSKDAFLFAIGIASSIIPQGLPAEINTTLAQAAKKLAKARALIKKLSAVETLGATSIICTDKTGTLTKNEMTVQQLMIGNMFFTVSGVGYQPDGEIRTEKGVLVGPKDLKAMEIFFAAGTMASNAHVNPPDDDHPSWHTVGDPTEGALITLAKKAGLDPLDIDEKHPELREFAFDSVRKRMSSVRNWGDDKQVYLFVKGAPESVLERCEQIWDHGLVRKISAAQKTAILKRNETLATEAMRNLGYAYRILPAKTNVEDLAMDKAETGLVWMGMVSMIDPLREDVRAAMDDALKAHIKVSIVTGDYATTARAIAIKAGLADAGGNITIVTGLEARALDDAQVLRLVQKGSVIFSRVSPEDKLRIVGLVKDSGQVIAVTGDGINDAPALKRADIGVAMGKTGTDVAKQSSEIVLLDDSFRTLIGAIQQGRVVFQNIRKGTLSCFTSNSAELVVNLTSLAAFSIFHIPLALSVMEILAIDLIAELFPIAALAWDEADGDLMEELPRNPHHHILNKFTITDLLWCGILIGGLAFGNFLLFFSRVGVSPRGIQAGSLLHMKATAVTYLTIVLCQLGNILQRRSINGLFTRYQLHNKRLWMAMALSLFCVSNVIYNPWIAPYFKASSITLVDWLYAILAAIIFLGIREFQRYSSQHSRANIIHLHRQKIANS